MRNIVALLVMLLLSGCGSMWLSRLLPATDPRLGQAPMGATSKSQARAYFDLPNPKAFAFSPERGTNRHTWGSESVEAAKQTAMGQCEELTRTRCVLFAVNDEIVWRPPSGSAAMAAAARDVDTGAPEAVGAGTHLVGTFDLRGGRKAVLQVVNPTGEELLLLSAFYDDSGTPLRCRTARLTAGGLAEVDVRKAGVKAPLGVVRVIAFAESEGLPVAGLISGTPGLQSALAPLGGDQLAAFGRLCNWRPGGPTLSATAGPPGGKP